MHRQAEAAVVMQNSFCKLFARQTSALLKIHELGAKKGETKIARATSESINLAEPMVSP
jgi:hypothetical protein